MKKLFSILIIAFSFICSVYAQQGKQFLQGKINDAETGKPIDKGDVLDKFSGAGTASDNNGNFKLLLQFPVRIVVSHIGYETQIINLQTAPDNVFFISLKKSSTELPVVSVLPSRVENIILNNNLSVMDYEFIGNNILLLAQSTPSLKSSLVLLGENFDTISIAALDVHPEFIFHDCMDNLHLVAKEFAFQLNYDGRKIQLLYPTSSDKMKEKLLPCVEKLHNRYYFSEYSNKGLSLLYFFKDSGEEKSNLLRVISDRKKLNMLESEISFALAPGHKYEEWDKHFFDSMVVSKVYAPLVKLRDSIYLFDFATGNIEQYSENGKMLNSVKILFHTQRGWKKNLLTDELENKCYAVFEKNGVIQLKQINIKTGEVESSTDFSGFPFAKNIKVRNGYVYFIYPDETRAGYEKLYRKRL